VNGTFAINTVGSNASGISGVQPALNVTQQSIFLGNQAGQKVAAVRTPGTHLASVNVSTKLQQQLLTLPDASKTS